MHPKGWDITNNATCNLQIIATPTLAKEHTISVAMTDDAGQTWKASIKLKWSK